MDLISVIIPCFNRQPFIRQCIDSALGQSYGAVEVIVVDDGSTDDSWSIIMSYGDAIRAVRIENGGVGRARNHGIALARGKYLKFLDSDDLLPRNALAQLIDVDCRVPDNFIVVGQAHSINSDGQEISFKYNFLEMEPGKIPRSTLLSWTVSNCMPLLPAKAVKDVGGFREDLFFAEDYDLACRLHIGGYRFYYSDIVSAIVRMHKMGRLSVDPKPVAYERADAMFRDIMARFDSDDVTALSDDERAAVARKIWRHAREAARYGYESQAGQLFKLAYQIAGPKAFIGNPILKILYRAFRAEVLEKYSMVYRLAIGRLIKSNTS